MTEPILQRRFAETEIGGDLLDGDTALTATSDRDNVLVELPGIGPGMMTSSPPAPPGTNDQMSPIRSSRPTFATLALESGQLSMFELSVAMGHESEAVTNEVYTHLRKRDHSAKRAASSAFLAQQSATPAPVRQIGV